MPCVWWDHIGAVRYELLKPYKISSTQRYRQQTNNVNHALLKNPYWAGTYGKKILLHHNASSHALKLVKELLNSLKKTYSSTHHIQLTWQNLAVTFLHQ